MNLLPANHHPFPQGTAAALAAAVALGLGLGVGEPRNLFISLTTSPCTRQQQIYKP